MPSWQTEIDHTGDLAFVVRASSREELFERCASCLFGVLTDLSSVLPTTAWHITVRAGDRDALLVRWLSELNYLHLTASLVFSSFRITEHTDTMLTAEVRGEPIDMERHRIMTEIKAVTYHGLRIEHVRDLWTAQIIFDL